MASLQARGELHLLWHAFAFANGAWVSSLATLLHNPLVMVATSTADRCLSLVRAPRPDAQQGTRPLARVQLVDPSPTTFDPAAAATVLPRSKAWDSAVVSVHSQALRGESHGTSASAGTDRGGLGSTNPPIEASGSVALLWRALEASFAVCEHRVTVVHFRSAG